MSRRRELARRLAALGDIAKRRAPNYTLAHGFLKSGRSSEGARQPEKGSGSLCPHSQRPTTVGPEQAQDVCRPGFMPVGAPPIRLADLPGG
jgi:hypothetical protein